MSIENIYPYYNENEVDAEGDIYIIDLFNAIYGTIDTYTAPSMEELRKQIQRRVKKLGSENPNNINRKG